MPSFDDDVLLASHPSTPASELARIAAERPDLHVALAINPATYSALVEWLALSTDPAVQQAVAARRSLETRQAGRSQQTVTSILPTEAERAVTSGAVRGSTADTSQQASPLHELQVAQQQPRYQDSSGHAGNPGEAVSPSVAASLSDANVSYGQGSAGNPCVQSSIAASSVISASSATPFDDSNDEQGIGSLPKPGVSMSFAERKALDARQVLKNWIIGVSACALAVGAVVWGLAVEREQQRNRSFPTPSNAWSTGVKSLGSVEADGYVVDMETKIMYAVRDDVNTVKISSNIITDQGLVAGFARDVPAEGGSVLLWDDYLIVGNELFSSDFFYEATPPWGTESMVLGVVGNIAVTRTETPSGDFVMRGWKRNGDIVGTKAWEFSGGGDFIHYSGAKFDDYFVYSDEFASWLVDASSGEKKEIPGLDTIVEFYPKRDGMLICDFDVQCVSIGLNGSIGDVVNMAGYPMDTHPLELFSYDSTIGEAMSFMQKGDLGWSNLVAHADSSCDSLVIGDVEFDSYVDSHVGELNGTACRPFATGALASSNGRVLLLSDGLYHLLTGSLIRGFDGWPRLYSSELLVVQSYANRSVTVFTPKVLEQR